MKTLSLERACDLHIHSAPDLFDRIGNDLEIAQRAKDAGMRSIVLKSVLEPTYSRAWHVMQQIPELKVFGGVVLDHHVGGLNPAAVDPAIRMGGKVVWMPTYHAYGHQQAFGAIGSFGYLNEPKQKFMLEPLTILDKDGGIQECVKIIMELCRDGEVILATGHLHASETLLLAKLAKEMNFTRLVVNHPFFKVPKMSVEMIGQLTQLGAYIEFCANELCPIPESASLGSYVACVEQFGTSHFILASDAGHNRKGWPTDELRIFAQLLGYSGISEEKLRPMMCDNYDYLLRL